MTEIWAKWESQVVNGIFPLRRFLGRSNHSVVFLTEHAARKSAGAAIKLVPADPQLAESQLSHWRRAAAFAHPHLICILDAGRCQLGGHPFLFVVMEYAEETLAKVLPRRPLTPDEVREMLTPALDALAFLHGKGWVHGQLKPPNILVVNDQVKLASDNARPAGDPSTSIARRSPYDAPEAKSGHNPAAGDIWGLGVTMVEALTQRAPPRPDARSEAISLPAALPPAFADAVRRCLSRNPDERPTIADLQSQTEPVPQAAAMPASQAAEVRDSQDRAMPVPQAPATPVPEAATSGREAATPVPGAVATPVPPPATRETWEATALRRLPKRVPLVPAAMAGFTVLLVVWGGSRLLHKHPGSAQPPSAVAETSTPPAAPPPEPEQSPKASMSAPSAVIHREIPEVSRGARASIRGHIKVTVRVTVDRSGNVIRQTLQNPGSSKYFARLASAAAGKWKFGPSDDQALRVWLLSFEFARGGATGLAAEQR